MTNFEDQDIFGDTPAELRQIDLERVLSHVSVNAPKGMSKGELISAFAIATMYYLSEIGLLQLEDEENNGGNCFVN